MPMPISTLNNLVGKNLKDFYYRFNDDVNKPLRGNGAWKLSQDYLFNIMFWFTPFLSKINGYVAANLNFDPFALTMQFQSIEIPKLMLHSLNVEGENVGSGDTSDDQYVRTEFGYGAIGNTVVLPESNTFSAEILNTEFSLHEHAFYYWLQEIDTQQWIYKDFPFTRATAIIRCLNSRNHNTGAAYLLSNVYPTSIELKQFNHDADQSAITRKIEFNFSRLIILPNVDNIIGMMRDVATDPMGQLRSMSPL